MPNIPSAHFERAKRPPFIKDIKYKANPSPAKIDFAPTCIATTMNLNIRSANQDDKPSLLLLFSELQSYEKSVYPGRVAPEGIVEEYMEDSIRAMLEGKYQIFVAEFEGHVIGFAGAHPFDRLDEIVNIEKTYFIEDLVVSKEYRGNGVGKQLLDFIEEYAKERGYKQYGLSVLAANKTARDFYLKYGFEEYSVEYIKKFS